MVRRNWHVEQPNQICVPSCAFWWTASHVLGGVRRSTRIWTLCFVHLLRLKAQFIWNSFSSVGYNKNSYIFNIKPNNHITTVFCTLYAYISLNDPVGRGTAYQSTVKYKHLGPKRCNTNSGEEPFYQRNILHSLDSSWDLGRVCYRDFDADAVALPLELADWLSVVSNETHILYE